MIRLVAALVLASITASSADAHTKSRANPDLTADAINSAGPERNDAALITKAEVLLDRNHFSPGQIDGKDGENFRKALAAFQQTQKLNPTGKIDADTWSALAPKSPAPVLKRYTISEEDVAGPFEKQIPRQLEQMAKLHGLTYKSPLEELSEKFHMNESLLRTLNPGADFERAGTTITVADVLPMVLHRTQHTIEAVRPTREQTERQSADTIVVDKPAREVRAYTKDGKLLGFYPATIGSDEKPAPTGTFKVRRVAWNPDYHYDPKFRWKNVKTKQKLTIAPGPNNPVGLVWIDLSAPSYGIHGTPEPDTIGKTSSHGCIRLTNWDAVDLAAMAHPGTVVKFEDQDSPIVPLASR
jgi:lipoprotein-anchoring transpeptidase ErfK/SrfK